MKTQLEEKTDALVTSLRLEHRSCDARVCVLSEWRRLEARIGDRGLSCSADWTEVWLSTYGDLVPHRFVMAIDGENGQLVGICLITEGVDQKDGPLTIRTLHVGTAGEPEADSVCIEYNRLLVESRFEGEFASQIVAYLESQTGFDQWNLDGFAEADLAAFLDNRRRISPESACPGGDDDSAGYELNPDAHDDSNSRDDGTREASRFPRNLPALELTREPCHWFDLKKTRNAGSTILADLRSSARRKVKRSFEAYEDVTVDFSETLDEAADIFGELMELHQARWNSVGQPGSYSSDRFVEFHEGLLARLVPQGKMALIRVRTEAGTLGCVQLFVEHGRVMLYQCGWSPTDGTRSPGVVLDYVAMKECFERGYDAYDFLAFATQHKRHLSNACHDIVWARRKHPKLKFAVLDQARKVKRLLTRSGKTAGGS